MIVFGCAISDREIFERVAQPSIRRLAEPNSRVLTREGYGSVQEPYNEMMDEAAASADLEALILLHQDVELRDESLLLRIRPLLETPEVGLIGIFGGRRPPALLFTEGDARRGRSVTPLVDEHHSSGAHEVEVIDGVLMAIAPWVVHSIRFSEALSADFHGYDIDLSMRVKAAGGRVICTDAPYFHHMERPWSSVAQVHRAGYALAKMWDPELRPDAWAPSFSR